MVQGTGCCCIALLPAVVATLGIASSVLSTVWCEAIKFTPDLSGTPDFVNLSNATRNVLSNEDGFATLQYGLFYYRQVQDVGIESAGDAVVRVTSSCVEYGGDVKFDAAWRSAQAFAMIAPIAAAALALGLYMSPCCCFFRINTWRKMAGLYLLVIPAFQSFTLLFLISDACKDNPVIESRMDQALQAISTGLSSDSTTTITSTSAPASGNNMTEAPEVEMTGTSDAMIDSDTEEALRSIYAADCEWDWGTWANLVSMCLFFLTGLIMIMMGPPTKPEPKEPELQTVTYEQKEDENGQTKVEEVDVQTESINPTGAPHWANPNQSTPVPPSNDFAKPY